MISVHLGRRIHDLLDGRMSPEQTYTAMAHLAECAQCSLQWHDLRVAREALNSSDAGIDMRFASNLLDRDRIAVIAAGEAPEKVKAARGRSHTPMVATVAITALMSASVSTAYMIGAPTSVTPIYATPATSQGTAQTIAYHGPANMRSEDHLQSWLHPDWSAPGIDPVEARVVHDRNGDPVLVASLVVDMNPVVLTEQHGRLDSTVKSDLPSVEAGEVTMYISNYYPPQAVWESGDVVVSASCECTMGVLESVAEAFPVDSEPGFVERVAAGFGEVADALLGD